MSVDMAELAGVGSSRVAVSGFGASAGLAGSGSLRAASGFGISAGGAEAGSLRAVSGFGISALTGPSRLGSAAGGATTGFSAVAAGALSFEPVGCESTGAGEGSVCAERAGSC